MPTKTKRPARKPKKKTTRRKKQNGTGYASDAWDYVGKNKGKIATGALIGGLSGLGLLAGTAFKLNANRADFVKNRAPELIWGSY